MEIKPLLLLGAASVVLAASKQTSDLNNDKTCLMLCAQREMRLSDDGFDHLYIAVRAESQKRARVGIEAGGLGCMGHCHVAA